MLKKIKDKIKAVADKHNENVYNGIMGWYNLAHDLSNSNAKFRCDKCKAILGFIRMMIHAKKVQKGEPYTIECKKCEFINLRIKGENNGNRD